MVQEIFLNDQAGSGKPIIMDSKALLQAIEANSVNSSQIISGKLGISQFNVFHHLHDLGKSIQSCWTVPPVSKILQNFWLNQVKTEF